MRIPPNDQWTVGYFIVFPLTRVSASRAISDQPDIVHFGVTVEVTETPPPTVGTNYKPLVALIFAIVLAVVGLWSSRRRPWKGGEDRRAVAMAFAFTCLPFILAEIMTGILSVSVDPLKIPPVIGWGTGVDVLILVIGALFSLLRLVRKDGGMELQETNEQEQSR